MRYLLNPKVFYLTDSILVYHPSQLPPLSIKKLPKCTVTQIKNSWQVQSE